MNQQRLQTLIERRNETAAAVERMASVPTDERPKKPADLKAWLRDMASLQQLVEQMDKLIERAAPKPRVAVPDVVDSRDPETGDVITVARVKKGRRAEIRVTVKPWQGRRVVDIRLWSYIDGEGEEMKPSRKGIAFDAGKLEAVIEAMHQAKQHV